MPTSSPTSNPFNDQLVRQLNVPYRMLLSLAEDFTEEEAHARVEGLKPLVWYLAHVITSKSYLVTLYADANERLAPEHHARFGRGSSGEDDFAGASKEETLERLKDVHRRARSFLATIAPEDLARTPEIEVRHPLFRTLGDAISIAVSHDAYHAGQIAVLRRAMGKDPLFG